MIARLFRAPGVPRFNGTDIRPNASRPPPRKRSSTSGKPRIQRAFARIVATPLPFNTGVASVWRMRLPPLSPRDAAVMCRLFVPVKPVFSM